MLKATDYASLVSDRVAPSMIALVESCYHAIFEAAAPAAVQATPIPWKEIADQLGIDVSDCVVDGELKPRMISQKLQETPVFSSILDFVTKTIDRGVSLSGADAYPSLEKSPTFNNFKYNLRTKLLVSVVKRAARDSSYEWWEDDGFRDYLASRIAKIIGSKILPGMTKINRYTEPDDIDEDTGKHIIPRYTSVPSNTVFIGKNGNRLERNLYNPNELNWIPNSRTGILGHITVVPENTNILESFRSLTSSEPFYEDVARYLANGPINGTVRETCIENEDADEIVSNASSESLVKIRRNKPELFKTLKTQAIAEKEYLDAVDFLVTAFDTGTADADELFAIYHASVNGADPGEEMSPRTLLLGTKMFGGGSRFNRIIKNIDAWKPEKLLEYITGKTTDKPDTKHFKNWYGNLLYDDDVQMRKYLSDGIIELLHGLSNAISEYDVYIPIADNVLRKVFRSSERNPFDMKEVIRYFVTHVSGPGTMPQALKDLFNKVRTYITPRVQAELIEYCNQENNDNPLNDLNELALNVPGFHALGFRDMPRTDAGEIQSFNYVTPRQCIKILSRYGRRGGVDLDIDQLVEAVTSPDVLAEVSGNSKKNKGYLATRIMELVTEKMLGPVSCYMFHKMLFADHKEPKLMNRNVDFIRAYIEPNIQWVRNTSICMLMENIAQGDSPVDAQNGYTTGVMALFNHDATVASEVYLDSNGLLDMGTGPARSGLVGLARCLRKTMFTADEMGWTDTWLKITSALLPGKHLMKEIAETPSKYSVKVGVEMFDLADEYNTRLGADSPDQIISEDDFVELMERRPEVLIAALPEINSTDWVAKICSNCLTEDFVDRMATTEDGLKLLIDISSISGWNGFSDQFIRANSIRINKLLDTLPPEQSSKLRSMLGDRMQGTNDTYAHGGTRHSESMGGSTAYHEANGLLWMSGFIDMPSSKVRSPKTSASLLTAEQVSQVLQRVRAEGWRLPTSRELEHLGDDPEIIARKQLGFAPTGRADAEGNIVPLSDSTCYAWCVGEDGELSGYSVTSNLIDTDDFDIDPTDMLAVKLVR